jgi:hypothetical protein
MIKPIRWKLAAALAFAVLLATPPLRAGEDRPEALRAEMKALEEKAVRLKSEGKMEEAKEVRGQMEQVRERAKREMKEGGAGEGDARVAHIRQAMEHLRAAGMGDLAERVGQECKRRLEADRSREVRPAAGGSEVEQLRAELQELRQQVRKLSAERE